MFRKWKIIERILNNSSLSHSAKFDMEKHIIEHESRKLKYILWQIL